MQGLGLGEGQDGRPDAGTGAFGPNAWLVEDMYERYQADPSSVSASWQEFFADYRPTGTVPGRAGHAGAGRAGTAPPGTARRPPPAPVGDRSRVPMPLRGAAGRIVANMEASLGVPTATSVRVVPAKLLEVNRTIVNNQLQRTTGGKVSFTHLIGYAVVKGAGRRTGHERRVRRPTPTARGPRASSATSTSASAWPSTSRRAAAAPCSCRASPRPTPGTSRASSPPTRTWSARSTPTRSPRTTSPAPPSP